jgi:hypothetical protein
LSSPPFSLNYLAVSHTINKQRFPTGWDEQRVKRLLAELEAHTDEEWIAADEAAAADGADQAVNYRPFELAA